MSFDPEKITFFAKTDARGQQIPFGIKAKDRQRHMYVVGKTGMGKSTLLENMAAQDIQNGEGMAFIDPHGSAAETLLDYVPEHRVNDVIYFAPFDLANPISFNVMEDVGPDKRHLVVSGLMSTFKKIWVDAWSARMEYILTNALLALIEYPDTTLLSVNRLFSDKAYRTQVVEYIKDPAVKAFWTEEFANYTDRFAAEALPAIQNKIGQFTGNPLIRNIIGQPHSSFDIRKIMDEKKILIMNLSKGLVGETNANLLGSMLTTRIYLGAMSRADLPVHQMKTMPNFYFYVDEFQSFANATFANILSEARKYHLNLIIAHQYIEQMEEDVRNAVFGNVGSTIAFRVGPFDAEVLETVFSPRFLAADLVNLGFAQIYLTLMIDGIGSQPFSAVTLPPVSRPSVSCKEMVIAASRRNYTKSRDVVEQIITDLHTPVKVEKPAPKPGAVKAGTVGGGKVTPSPVSQAQYTDRSALMPSSPGTPTSKPAGVVSTEAASSSSGMPRQSAATRELSAMNQSEKPQAASVSINGVRQSSPVVNPSRTEEGKKRNDFDKAARPSRKDDERKKIPTVQDGSRTRPSPSVPSSPTGGRSLDELRSVLARISSAEKKDVVLNVTSDHSTKLGSAAKITPPKADLASALQKIGAVASVVTDSVSNSNDVTAAPPQLKDQPAAHAHQQKDAAAIQETATTSPAREKTSAHHDELRRLAAEAEAAFAELENSSQPVPVNQQSKVPDDPLAPKKIEQMFRQPRNERSPFTS